jgi:hypothetical protein
VVANRKSAITGAAGGCREGDQNCVCAMSEVSHSSHEMRCVCHTIVQPMYHISSQLVSHLCSQPASQSASQQASHALSPFPPFSCSPSYHSSVNHSPTRPHSLTHSRTHAPLTQSLPLTHSLIVPPSPFTHRPSLPPSLSHPPVTCLPSYSSHSAITQSLSSSSSMLPCVQSLSSKSSSMLPCVRTLSDSFSMHLAFTRGEEEGDRCHLAWNGFPTVLKSRTLVTVASLMQCIESNCCIVMCTLSTTWACCRHACPCVTGRQCAVCHVVLSDKLSEGVCVAALRAAVSACPVSCCCCCRRAHAASGAAGGPPAHTDSSAGVCLAAL